MFYSEQEFIDKLQGENDELQNDNECLARSNVQYEGYIQTHDVEIKQQVETSATFAPQLARWDSGKDKVHARERSAAVIEKKLDQDLNDLVEYTKWMSEQCAGMRSRVRKAEKVISDLRTSGEDSVEQLMETLYLLKMKVEEREKEADKMRTIIREKEDEIQYKEGEKAAIK